MQTHLCYLFLTDQLFLQLPQVRTALRVKFWGLM